MIIKSNSINDYNICDEFLNLLIQVERKYDNTIDEDFVVSNHFINILNEQNILLLYKNDKMFLIDTIGHEQDLYEKTCEELLNFEIEENTSKIWFNSKGIYVSYRS